MAMQSLGEYNIDIVMCIDGTGSMTPIINEVKTNALSFYRRFIDAMNEQGKTASQVRVKVIVFGDYGVDANPMKESEFFTLPEQDAEFNAYVNGIEAQGGGDIPENALEAIALALKSEWTTGGTNRRHAILVFSDAAALELGVRKDSPNYPEGMPESLAQLGDWWEGADQTLGSTYQPTKGRLVAFVPNAYPWADMQGWSRYWPTFSAAGTGLSELEIQQAIDILVGSF